METFQNMSVQVKASMAFMIVNFMQKGISFLTAPIFTRLLSTEEYGQVTIYLSWVDLIGIFAMLGLYNNVFYNGITEFKTDKKRFTFSMLSLANIITLLTFTGCTTGYFLVSRRIWSITSGIHLDPGTNEILFLVRIHGKTGRNGTRYY